MANLADVTVFKPGIEADTDDQVEDGVFNEAEEEKETKAPADGVIVQLSFRRLPQEVLTPLIRLIASPREPKLFRFVKDGQARTGVQIEVRPEDFPGEEYDYAF